MAEKEYIEKQSIIDAVRKEFDLYYQIPIYPGDKEVQNLIARVNRVVLENPAADVVEVVRCKDCKWFVPKHIRLDDGSTREYTEEEKKLPLGVPGNVGINCGSRCMLHISWLENSVPVWVQENDFCSYGERKEERDG